MEPFETLATATNTTFGETVTYAEVSILMTFSRAAQLGEGETVGVLLASAPAALFTTAPAAGDQVAREGVNYVVVGEPQLDPIDCTYRLVLDQVR
jgi:hypothetical protein